MTPWPVLAAQEPATPQRPDIRFIADAGWMATAWLVRTVAPAWLRTDGHASAADQLAGMSLATEADCEKAKAIIKAAVALPDGGLHYSDWHATGRALAAYMVARDSEAPPVCHAAAWWAASGAP